MFFKSESPTYSDRWLIAGLGNPGKEYEKTRHNIGFMVIEHLSRQTGISGKNEGKFNAMVGTGHLAGQPIILVQPLTYMNKSGEAIGKLMKFYKVAPERLLVIYDDVALPFGKLRVRPSGSAGGHNGMKSIIQHLGGNDCFPRLRIGIGEGVAPLHHHVLSKFTPDEQNRLEELLSLSAQAVETLIQEGVEAAMNRYNGLDLSEA